MTEHHEDAGPQQDATSALLREAARHMLERSDELADRVTARLHTEAPGFVDHGGDPDRSPGEIATIIRLHLDRLVEPECDAVTIRHMRAVGRRQAEQGMPLELLMHALAVGGAVMWQELVDTVAAHHPDRIHLMVHIAPRMWGFRERSAAILTDAYREALGACAADDSELAATLLGVLLDGRTNSLDVRAAAQVLGVPAQGRFVVAVTSVRTSASGTPGDDAFPVGSGNRILRAPRGAGEVLVVLLGDRPPAVLARLLRAVPRLRAGVSPVVEGLSELHQALTLAGLALSTCSADDEVALWEDRVPAALIALDRPLAGELADRVLGPLRELPDGERDSLLGTFAAWMDCDGCLRTAAERLDCHRNTVLNRLRRLELLTGRRLGRPRDLVDLTLAVDVFRIGNQ
ncbi:PucR family transcriptional regulator [Streptomyces sp. NPDC001070]